MPTITEVQLINIALDKIGVAVITARTDSTPQAQMVNRIYDRIRDAMLTEHIWTFAQKRVALTDSGSDPTYTDDGMTEMYNKPSDLLKINFTNVETAHVKVEGNYILSDTTELKIQYTFQAGATADYSSEFIEAFAARLAYEMCYPLTHNRTLASDLYQVYKDKLASAISADSQQGTPLEPIQDDWLLSRISGGAGQLFGRTGWSTWYPL